MRARADAWRRAGASIGLVPTMGALHRGHLALVARARADCDRVVVSIFVNPLQFDRGDDFARYPRTLEADLAALATAGVDAVYAPGAEAMYPPGAATRVRVEGIADPLEGAHRPGHFEGVATVVMKLLGAVGPDRAYFGRKDAQQVAVVTRMVADLDLGVEVVACPTVREPDGLALSSRNALLSAAERAAARCLSRGLAAVDGAWRAGQRDHDRLLAALRAPIEAEPLAEVEYADLVDPAGFRPPGPLAVVAVRFGATRLIDNHLLGEPLEVPAA